MEVAGEYQVIRGVLEVDVLGDGRDPVRNEKGWEIGRMDDLIVSAQYPTRREPTVNGAVNRCSV